MSVENNIAVATETLQRLDSYMSEVEEQGVSARFGRFRGEDDAPALFPCGIPAGVAADNKLKLAFDRLQSKHAKATTRIRDLMGVLQRTSSRLRLLHHDLEPFVAEYRRLKTIEQRLINIETNAKRQVDVAMKVMHDKPELGMGAAIFTGVASRSQAVAHLARTGKELKEPAYG